MSKLTNVYNLTTSEIEASYMLPPIEALVACWEQHHKNFNTWEYAKKLEQDCYPLVPGLYGITLGIFWVRKETS